MIQNKPFLIGITGAIATGKSTASNIIKKMGYPIVDADLIARQVVEPGQACLRELVKEFGESILNGNGSLDRKALGAIIFNDIKARQKLNLIIHPFIFEKIKVSIEESSKKNTFIFLDIPLLFEEYPMLEKYQIFLDEIWLVYTDLDTQIQRLTKRDGISVEDAQKKIASQISIEDKKDKANYILDNTKDRCYLEKQIQELLDRLKSLEG